MLNVDVTQIPQGMKILPNWVCWKLVPKKKPTPHSAYDKIPINPRNGYGAKASDPTTWTDFDTACRYAHDHDDITGIGFEFGNTDMIGIDIDDLPIDSDVVQEFLRSIHSYAEFSQSGNGIHIYGFGELPGRSYKNNPVEMYRCGKKEDGSIDGGRFFVVTGNRVSEETDVICITEPTAPLYQKYKKQGTHEEHRNKNKTVSIMPIALTDRELIEKAMDNRTSGEKFKMLYNGKWESYYKSQSEADMALLGMLAFWTAKDAERMDRIFRTSGLMRDKWDRKQSGSTYGAISIQNAIDKQDKIYEPKPQTVGGTSMTNIGSAFLDGIAGYADIEVSDTPEADETATAEENKNRNPQNFGIQIFNDFIAKIQTEVYKPLPTGMQSFDEMLGGGIPRQSLVILTAAPGAGKTALTQQIFETMAAGGHGVLFFNLEMSREQLMARSLSRIIKKQGHNMSSTAIMRGYKWSGEQAEWVNFAGEEYKARIAKRMWYNPYDGTDLDGILKAINDVAEKCKKADAPAPVVVIDYLHLVTANQQQEQAELLKKAVAGFKQYAINYDTFVFCIAANNRATNQSGQINLGSGRDTSAIEYSADIQLALNYRELAEPGKQENLKRNGKPYSATNPNDMEILQRMEPRHMVLQVLKNRMCGISPKLYMNFDAASSLFTAVVNVDTDLFDELDTEAEDSLDEFL